MTTYRSLNHTKWCCQYHVVFIPKYRRKAMYEACGRSWTKYSGGWRCTGRVRWRKGICCRTTST